MSEGNDATLPDTRHQQTDPVARVSVADLGDRYEVGPVLGRGGMGEIRLARDLRIDREVAVKLMRSQERDEQTLGRFFREARVQGVLEHPAVVPVHDLGIDREGNPYFVMKRLAGTTLHDVISSKDPAILDRWPRRTLLARLVDVCLAIDFAHTRGVIHRDVKPANIMLGDFGEAYILDWGLARIADEAESFRGVARLSGDAVGQTVAGDLLGTPGYMSPEQARGEVVHAATDVFALGTVLYEVLARAPALPRGMQAIAETLTSDRHRPSKVTADVPPELDDLCADCTDATAKSRPTARALADRLQAYLDGDRDVARRTELADEAMRAARAAAKSKDDDARATAMREAGRALALVPDHVPAQELLASLMFDLPDRMPAEALVAADEERAIVRQRAMKKAAYGYVVMGLMLAVVFALPYKRAWPIAVSMGTAMLAAACAYALSRRRLSMTSGWMMAFAAINCATVATTGLMFGVLLLLPMFFVGSLSAFVSGPSRHPVWLILAVHAAPIALLFVLELTGVLPQSFHVSAGSLVITPYAVELTPAALAIVYSVGLVAQVGSTMDIQSTMRAEQEAAQNKIHSQTWHLKQLLPRGGKLPKSDTQPTPKV
ncbi:MAG: serine/threonine protein kinase [Deltaproteobacteria bacterium]|nr:serine/threonine protein kinase [Deltaproteobacteria bacterium]